MNPGGWGWCGHTPVSSGSARRGSNPRCGVRLPDGHSQGVHFGAHLAVHLGGEAAEHPEEAFLGGDGSIKIAKTAPRVSGRCRSFPRDLRRIAPRHAVVAVAGVSQHDRAESGVPFGEAHRFRERGIESEAASKKPAHNCPGRAREPRAQDRRARWCRRRGPSCCPSARGRDQVRGAAKHRVNTQLPAGDDEVHMHGLRLFGKSRRTIRIHSMTSPASRCVSPSVCTTSHSSGCALWSRGAWRRYR